MIRVREEINKEEIFDNIMKDIDKKEQVINEVLGDEQYILWLINFLEANNWCFEVSSIDSISLEEKNNLDKLVYFKEGIGRYAREKLIYPSSLNCGRGYFIQYKENIYELYWIAGLEKDFCWFVRAIDDKKVKNVINFRDVLNNKRENMDLIKNRLSLLSEFIEDSVEIGVSSQAILDTVEKTLSKRLVKRKDNK